VGRRGRRPLGRPHHDCPVTEIVGSTSTIERVGDRVGGEPLMANEPVTRAQLAPCVWPGYEVDDLIFGRETAVSWADGEEGFD
jgi:hypothetical protein